MSYYKKLSDYGFKTQNRTYIIAEVGINHGGNIEIAKKLIESAKKSGCDAVKFQTYSTEKRTFPGSPIFNILKECELPYSAFEELQKVSKDLGIDFFSTPFDNEAADFLASIGADLIKIASFDVTNKAFLKKIAQKNLPVIMSTGMSNLEEIKSAYNLLKEGTNKIALLHCVSSYPTEPVDSNLASIFVLKQNFDCVIGHSDHTNDIQVPLMAVSAGAQVLEKHYKIESNMKCVDAPVSISEDQMKQLVQQTRYIEQVFGHEVKQLFSNEQGATIFRRQS